MARTPSIYLALSLLLLASTGAEARKPPIGAVIGQASVVDGDTLDIHGTRIRLFGIDAPESKQLCLDASRRPYRCGAVAANALSDFIARRPVTCDPRDMDRYGRIVAQCSVGGVDLNAWLVGNGHALAFRQYSQTYVPAESRAQAARRGIHAGSFQAPWEFRKAKRKGNQQ